MAPHDLPYGYDPDISTADVSFFELEAIGNFYNTHFDFEFDEPQDADVDFYDTDEDWESQYPPTTPYVPTAEVVAWVDVLIQEMIDRANLLTFGTTDPQDNDYEEFFKHFKNNVRHEVHYRHYDDDEDDDDEDYLF